MSYTVVRTKNDFLAQPWKNGGGTTLELFKLSHPHRNDFYFRLSVATIDRPGPFSQFVGIDRHLVLLKGEGIELTMADEKKLQLTRPGDLIAFAGEESVFGTPLAGSSQDFNVMYERNWAQVRTSVQKLTAGVVWELPAEPWVFIFEPQTQRLIELKNTHYTLTPNSDSWCVLVQITL